MTTAEPTAEQYAAMEEKLHRLERELREAEAMQRYKLKPWNLPSKLIWGAVFAHIGVLIVVALYYGLFETTPFMKHLWDSNVQPASLRHSIRDVGEGVLGALLAKGIMWNHFTKSHAKAGRLFDALHEKARIPSDVAALAATAAIFAVTFVAGTEILHALSVHSSSPNEVGSLWSRTQTLWSSDWDKKTLGFLCAFAASRPMHTVFDDVQEYFAGRRVALGRKPRFFYPKAFKNRYRYIKDSGTVAREFAPWVGHLMRGLVVAGLLAAGAGYYILTYVA